MLAELRRFNFKWVCLNCIQIETIVELVKVVDTKRKKSLPLYWFDNSVDDYKNN